MGTGTGSGSGSGPGKGTGTTAGRASAGRTGPAHPGVARDRHHVVARAGSLAALLHRRSAGVAGVLVAALLVAAGASLCLGTPDLPPSRVWAALTGRDPDAEVVVTVLRLPRVLLGALVGWAFGVAGALVQTAARNPLASPDVIGVSQGASAAAVGAVALGLTATPATAPWAAVVGGVAATALIGVVTGRARADPQRFVLVGVAISLALGSLTQLLLTTGEALSASQAKVWMTGSLNARDWSALPVLVWLVVLTAPLLVRAAWAQRTAALDDDTARSLGARAGRTRLGLLGLGVVHAAVATGAAGPVNFVALVAPQVARRLTRTATAPLVASGLCGALLVVVADLVARRALAPVELPVGVVTALVGAPYLLHLLLRRRPAP